MEGLDHVIRSFLCAMNTIELIGFTRKDDNQVVHKTDLLPNLDCSRSELYSDHPWDKKKHKPITNRLTTKSGTALDPNVFGSPMGCNEAISRLQIGSTAKFDRSRSELHSDHP